MHNSEKLFNKHLSPVRHPFCMVIKSSIFLYKFSTSQRKFNKALENIYLASKKVLKKMMKSKKNIRDKKKIKIYIKMVIFNSIFSKYSLI